MDWWEWIKDRYGDTKDYVEGYPDAYFSNVKQGLLQSAAQYKKSGGVGGPAWTLPFAFSLNPYNVAVDDAITAASKPIADITGAEQQDVKNTISAISMALPLLRSNKGLTLSGKTEGGTSLAKRPPLLEYKDKYPLSMWSDMPEWTATDVAQRGDAAPNPVDTFYYSRAVEKVRGLDTNTLYPLSDLVSWLPKSDVIDQSTGKKGTELSRYAKDAVKDELQYFGADHWAQDQIDLGREYFKPQELLDYLREQGEVPFRLRTSFVDVAGDLGFDISDEIEWTSQYGSGVTATTWTSGEYAADAPYASVDEVAPPAEIYRDWGTQSDPTQQGRGEYGYVNEGFVRGAPFTFPDVGPSDALRVRLYQDAPTTGDDIVESLLMDDYMTEPLKEEWTNTLGEIRVVGSHGTTGAHPVSTRVEVDVYGTGNNEYNAGFLENLSGSFGFQRPEDHVIDGPTYTVALSTPPMRFNLSDDWYWIGSDPEPNVSVNFDLTHLTNKADIPWIDRAAVNDDGMSVHDKRAVWGDLADTNRHSASLTMGARHSQEHKVPTNETVLLQAIEQYLKSSSEGGAMSTDIPLWYEDNASSIYSPRSLVEIRDGLGYNNWSPAVLRNAVSDGRVRLIPATEEGLDVLENRLLNYFGFVSENEFTPNQPLPSDGVTHLTLGYVSRENAPGVFEQYNQVPQWAVQFREASTGDPEWTTVKNVRSFDSAVNLFNSMYDFGDHRNILSDIQPKNVVKVLDNINKVITPPEAEASARAKLMDIFAHVRADLTEPQQDEGRIQVMKNTGGFNAAEWESYYNFSPLTPFVEQRYRFIAQSAFKNAMQRVNPYGWKTEALIAAQNADVFDNTGEDPDWLHHVTQLFSGVAGDEPDEIRAAEALSEFNRFWSRNQNWEVEYGGYLSGSEDFEHDDRGVSTRTYGSLGDARSFANDQIRSELEEVYPQDVNNLGAGEFSPQWQGYGLSHGSWNASIQDGTEKYREVLITVGNEQGYQHDALHFNWDYATEEFGDEGADVRSAYFGTNRLPPMLGDYPIDSDDASMWRDEHALPTKFVPRRFVEGVEFSGRQYPPIYNKMGHWSTVGRDLPGEHNLVSSMMVTEATYNPVDRPLWKPTGDIKELLISELQGDVHQFGSAYGYGRTGENVLDIPAGDPDFPQLEGARQEDIDPLREPFTVESHRRTAEDLGELAYHQTLLRSGQVGRPYKLAPGGTQEAQLRNQPLLPRTNPSSWVGNAVIEAVRFALENNYDYVTWPVGEEVVRKWRGQGPEKKKFYDSYMPKTARQVLGVDVEVGPHANRNGIIMMRIPIGDPEVKKTLMEFFKTQGIPTFSQTEQPRQVAYA